MRNHPAQLSATATPTRPANRSVTRQQPPTATADPSSLMSDDEHELDIDRELEEEEELQRELGEQQPWEEEPEEHQALENGDAQPTARHRPQVRAQQFHAHVGQTGQPPRSRAGITPWARGYGMPDVKVTTHQLQSAKLPALDGALVQTMAGGQVPLKPLENGTTVISCGSIYK